ncbi:MAG: peptidoglycan -binding protein [Rhodospirillales bacterium]|nr:peptidoglycan -binding protein [Rhodospirillales bacterium]
MAYSTRRARHGIDIWPGFVDALANLLLVFIFVLMVFVLAQFFLSRTLSGRDAALALLQGQVSELADLLALERRAKDDLSQSVAHLTDELNASIAARDALGEQVLALTRRAESAEAGLAEGQEAQRQVIKLSNDIAALQALKKELEEQAANLSEKAAESDKALAAERDLSETARAQVALLNQQMAALRDQITRLSATLAETEAKDRDQQIEIASLGKRLNAALASRVQELSRYRSEFFGRLREVLGDQPDIRIVGDRFVFQSEVLFETGSADLEQEGRSQLERVAQVLKDVAARIPPDIDWILQVEGHSDRIPIATPLYPSNWELSTARAMSVVRLLIEEGIPPSRLSAAGFGEFHPIDSGDDLAALRRNRRIEIKLTQR